MDIDIEKMKIAARDAEAMLKALAHRHRLLVLCQLIDGERSVGDLAQLVGVRSSTMSQYLALLRKDGLVEARRDGQAIYYSIASEPARQLLGTLAQIYCGPDVQAKPVKAKKVKRS